MTRNCEFRNSGIPFDRTVTYNMTLVAKDAKYKLTLDPIEWTDGYVYPDLIEDMGECTALLQSDLTAGIEKSSKDKDF